MTGTDGDFDIDFESKHFEGDPFADNGFDITIQLIDGNVVETNTIIGTDMIFKTTYERI